MKPITSDVSESGKAATDNRRLLAMLEDALRMAMFAAEKSKLPQGVSVGDLYRMRHQLGNGIAPLDETDINQIGAALALLQKELAPVTAASLAATECQNVMDCMDNQAGWHVRRLWRGAFTAVGLIAILNLIQYYYDFYSTDWVQTWPDGFAVLNLLYRLSVYVSPFTYGALGACVHVLRMTERHLRLRTFDARRIAQHRNRLVLGTLSGGVIVMFVTTGSGSDTAVKLTGAAAGFLAGYSVDFLFAILDRLLAAVVPNGVAEKSVTEGHAEKGGAAISQPVARVEEAAAPGTLHILAERPSGEGVTRSKTPVRPTSPEMQPN